VDGRLVLQRWMNRMVLSLLGSANLVRPRLRLDGPSDTASRHRHLGKGRVFARPGLGGWEWRPPRQGHASIAGRSDADIHIHI